MPLLCDFFKEYFCGFECRNVVSRNKDSGVLADVTGGFFRSLLDDETSESTEIYILAVCEAVLYHGHKLFNDGNNSSLVNAGCLCDLYLSPR